MSSPGAALPAPGGQISRGHSRSREERILWAVVGAALLLLAVAVRGDGQATAMLGAIVVGLVLVSYQRVLLAWQSMLGLILLIILFIPIRRYTVGSSLPIELEPYRIVIAVVLGCWFCALAADPKVRWRGTGLEAPMATLVVALLLSLAANIGSVNEHSTIVIKNFTFFLSYLLVVYFIASIVRSREAVDRMFKILVGGGTIVAFLSLVEWKTGTNFFNWYSHALPFLHYVDEGVAVERGTGIRARGSAQHPIALSAALVMLMPLAVYLFQRYRKPLWLVCAAILTLGSLSTGSRTGTTMLIAVGVAFLCMKPRETVRLLPWLLPLLILIQGVMPGTLGTIKMMFNPKFVIQEQSYDQGATAGRIADVGPALDSLVATAAVRLRLRHDDRGSQRGQGQRPADPRRSVAREPAADWRRGRARAPVALRPGDPASEPMCQGHNGRGRLAGDVARRVDHRVRRRHAHVRRVRLHPSHVLRVRDARVLGRRDASALRRDAGVDVRQHATGLRPRQLARALERGRAHPP